MSTRREPGPGPLDGLKVLDLTRVLSGPHCTRMLRDLGADVVKVEPPDGDTTRFSWPRVGSIATYFTQQNVGKRDISLDLKRPEAQELVRRLTDTSDVFVENFRPGVAARLGLGYAELAARNPRLVYASLSGYGQTGPWVDRLAYAPVVGAESGLTWLQSRERGGQLANDHISHGDVYTGLELVAAILAALYQRDRSGRGQWVEVSMAETLLSINEHVHWELSDLDVTGEVPSFQPSAYPVLPTAEGHAVIVSAHPAAKGTWERYVAVMERPELLTDTRFETVADRVANLADIHALLREWASPFTDLDDLEARFAAQGLALGVVRTIKEIAATEWAAQRGAIVEVDDRTGNGTTIAIPNSPFHFSDAESGARGVPAFRGEHNREVLSERLGLSDDELDRLEADGVLSSRPPRR